MKLRTIFWFWLPLAFSWLLMTFEGPWIQGVISRKADPELQLAAFGLIMSLSVLIEAPVIMFLAVGSALARDRQSYRTLSRYTMAINIILTGVAVLMAWTPLLDLYLGGLLGIPEPIIDAVRPGMTIMILWTGFIGYRRFHQGVLINQGRTHTIGTGTVLRIVASAGIAIVLGIWSALPGAVIGAAALIVAVLVEMLYVHWISRKDVRKLEATERPPKRKPLGYRQIMHFHIPLALTSVLTLLIRPVIERGLARADNAELALAAFPVVFSIMLIMRAGGLAWQEVVITLSRGPDEVRSLRKFTWILGLGTSGLMFLFTISPLINIYTGAILGVPPALQPLIRVGSIFGFLIPLFSAFQSYFRGMLMRTNITSPIYQGMGLGFALTAGIMWVGVQQGFPAIPAASVALTGGIMIELIYLWRAFAAHESKLTGVWQLAAVEG